MTNKIKILFLGANPVDAGYRLRLDEEIREIDERIQKATNRDSFEVISHFAVRSGDLLTALQRHNPHIVHFSGHGNKMKEIILEDKDGNMKPVSKQAVAELFKVMKKNIRLVLLNACHAKHLGDGIIKHIDFAIGMNKAIGDKDAIIFASFFYQSLAFGESVKAAFDMANTQLLIEGLSGFKTPVLLVRNGVDAAKTVLTEDVAETQQIRDFDYLYAKGSIYTHKENSDNETTTNINSGNKITTNVNSGNETLTNINSGNKTITNIGSNNTTTTNVGSNNTTTHTADSFNTTTNHKL
jgi:hypothetical protein